MSSRCLCSSGLRLRVDTGNRAAPCVFLFAARPAATIPRRWVDQHVVPLPLLPGEKSMISRPFEQFFSPCMVPLATTQARSSNRYSHSRLRSKRWAHHCARATCAAFTFHLDDWKSTAPNHSQPPFPPITAPRGIQQGKSPGNPQRSINHAGTRTSTVLYGTEASAAG